MPTIKFYGPGESRLGIMHVFNVPWVDQYVELSDKFYKVRAFAYTPEKKYDAVVWLIGPVGLGKN